MRLISTRRFPASETRKVVWVLPFDYLQFQIKLLCQMDISTFSLKDKVTKTCPKYLLSLFQTDFLSTKYRQIDQEKSNSVKNFLFIYLLCEYEYGRYVRLFRAAHYLASLPSG